MTTHKVEESPRQTGRCIHFQGREVSPDLYWGEGAWD